MFGIGPTELVVVAVLFLIIFGPSKMPQMARDIGKFVGQARGAIDEFKNELTAEPDDKDNENNKDRPTRSREEGSHRRKNGQDGHNRDDGKRDESYDPGEESSDSSNREPAEYDL